MSIQLTILGCHSATPRNNAHPTAQFLEINERHFLIDCGEGTQTLLRKNKIQFAKIRHIFISHLHGDHFYGLIGLISTFGLLNREHDLHIYGPKGIKEIITLQLKLCKSWTKFSLIFHELNSPESMVVFEDKKVIVRTIPLDHRIYTNGYLFQEKEGSRKLNMEKIKLNSEIQVCDYHHLKKGKNFIAPDGTEIPNEKLTLPPKKTISYAFCSDTAFLPSMVPILTKIDLLYHEATFLETEKELAKKTKHSTAKEAATIAKEAQVGQLIIGHYSNRYKDLDLFQKEAAGIFPNTHLAKTGKIFSID
jgi:ribonuclease Z